MRTRTLHTKRTTFLNAMGSVLNISGQPTGKRVLYIRSTPNIGRYFEDVAYLFNNAIEKVEPDVRKKLKKEQSRISDSE